MTDNPDLLPHRKYTVTLRALNGSAKDVRVITNRGVGKAVYLATLASSSLLRKVDVLNVEVVDDGPPNLDANGAADLRGYGFDRNEW